ncbi:unnamed protein product [Rotaria sordida]|uniref:GST C-terminal domain-containing protein n=1 Tax=Rotaria sordida TaxID=392033 RepID=A0A813XAJ4_9BILA|nr:unnamed protein product [Rotaria sordida]CAF3960607.1 unnamed protein product [Rotaria sordida]
MGTTPQEEALVMMLCEEAHDVRAKFRALCNKPNGGSDAEKKEFLATVLGVFFKQLDALLSKQNRKFAVSDQPTVADFLLYEYIDYCLSFDDEHKLLEQYPNVQRLLQQIQELPELKEYIATTHAQVPINIKSAKFGATVIKQK